MVNPINILAISDIHLGCPRLNSLDLHMRFQKYLYPQITKDISILFICGDFFDTLLNLNAVASLTSLEIIRELKHICREVGCDLRILRGTFTHDRNQPQHFINGDAEDDRTVRLFDTLSLEYHEQTGLNILYIPDNLSTDDIYGDIRKLLEAHNLEQADILVHHGYFRHMLPYGIKEPHGCLDVETIKRYVKGCVLNGHVHLSSICDHVISIGSFDRLAHGEEGPKGFYKIRINEEKAYQFEFIENKDANKFLTFDMRSCGTDATAAIQEFKDRWSRLLPTFKKNEVVRIRFHTEEQTIVDGCSQMAKEMWPSVIIDKSNVVKREQILENVNTSLEELPIISPANLEELLLPVVQKRHPNTTPQDIHDVISMCTTKEVN